MSTPSVPTAGEVVAGLASVLDRHVTDAAFESGCRLSCGYDGDDLTLHIAEAILASDWLAARESAAATRARAEGDRLRARIKRLADAAEWRAETSLSRTFTGETFGAWVSASDLRNALAPDTAGESA